MRPTLIVITMERIPDFFFFFAIHADADFCTIARRSSRPEFALAAASRLPGRTFRSFGIEDGSTCLIGMIRDGMLYIGNVGDSRAIMSTKSGKAISLSQGATAVCGCLLSGEHVS